VLLSILPMATGFAGKLGEEYQPALTHRPSFAILVRIAAVVALTLVLFAAVLADMARDWWIEPSLSQGMLLPPLACYFAWIHRRRTFSYAPAADYRGILLTASACLMFLLGKLASEFFLMRFSFVVLLAGLVWTFWGLPRLRTLAFPMLLLATMVPLPVMLYNSLAAPLQLLASDLATRIAQAIGVSVFRDGNVIQLAGTTLGVAEACSGLNSLSALIVGSVLLGYLMCSRLLSRIALFVLAVPLAIGVNIVRVAGTALIADYNQVFAEGFYHSFSGWLVFVAGFGALYLFARILHALFDPKVIAVS
jgi:exosortase